MINIFSIPEDRTTDRVMEYVRYISSVPTKRLQGDNKYYNLKVEINNEHKSVKLKDKKNKEYNLMRNKGWLRRGILSFNVPIPLDSYNSTIQRHIKKEISLLTEFIYSYSLKLGSYQKEIYNNRITNILVAKECGLKIPDTLITSSKSDLIDFFKKHDLIIAKPIHNGHLSFEHNNEAYSCKGTQIMDYEFISDLEVRFAPSLVQEYIEKYLELRIFYLNEKFYPMAIFSQLDEQTKYDYRNYNKIKPNRNVPFKLNDELEKKLVKFMKITGLNTGSIDIILTPEGDYYFLEVNPTGQFGWLSTDCNYYIEKEIAQNLINDGTK